MFPAGFEPASFRSGGGMSAICNYYNAIKTLFKVIIGTFLKFAEFLKLYPFSCPCNRLTILANVKLLYLLYSYHQ